MSIYLNDFSIRDSFSLRKENKLIKKRRIPSDYAITKVAIQHFSPSSPSSKTPSNSSKVTSYEKEKIKKSDSSERSIYQKFPEIIHAIYAEDFPQLNLKALFGNMEDNAGYDEGIEAGKTILNETKDRKALIQCAELLYYHCASPEFILGLLESGYNFEIPTMRRELANEKLKHEITFDFFAHMRLLVDSPKIEWLRKRANREYD